VPKGRPRFGTRNGKVRTYTPAATVGYEQRTQWRAREAVTKQGWTIGKDDVCKLHVTVRRPYLLKGGDADNIGKAIADACNGILYSDDCRIVHTTVEIRQSEKASAHVVCERYNRKDWE
jgi:Holliday junction resolvase RusA-like endonuclease